MDARQRGEVHAVRHPLQHQGTIEGDSAFKAARSSSLMPGSLQRLRRWGGWRRVLAARSSVQRRVVGDAVQPGADVIFTLAQGVAALPGLDKGLLTASGRHALGPGCRCSSAAALGCRCGRVFSRSCAVSAWRARLLWFTLITPMGRVLYQFYDFVEGGGFRCPSPVADTSERAGLFWYSFWS